MALLSAVGILSTSAAAREIKQQQVPDFRCDPKDVYRGEALTVTLLGPHNKSDLSILDADTRHVMVAFQPRPGDKFGPIISRKAFRYMNRVKLGTATARGVLVELKKGEIPPIDSPPRLIFTKEGNYEVLIGEDLRSTEGDFRVYSVRYHDYPRPASK